MRDQRSGIDDERWLNPYSKNGGDRRPRFWQDRASYRFLPPFFFPPLAAFFAIALIPPFVWDSFARSTLRIAAPLPAGTRRCVYTPLVASCWAEGVRPSDSRSLVCRALARRRVVAQKNRGWKVALHTPRTGRRRFSASFRPFSCRPLRSSSPLVPPWNVAAQLLPVTRGYNRWAERSTLIQDVDYG